MQDNTNDNINQEFTDQSWIKMRALLDKQLPVQSKSPDRKINSLIGLCLFLLLALLGVGYLYKTNPLIKEVIVEKIIYQPHYLPAVQSETKKEAKATTYLPTRQNNSPQRIVTESITQPNLTVATTISRYTRLDSGEHRQGESEEDGQLQAAINSNDNVDQLKPLASINTDIQALNLGDFELELEIDEPISEKRKRRLNSVKFELGWLLSMTSDFQFTGVGLSSGVRLSLSDKLAINTGLGINTFSSDRRLLGERTNPQPQSLSELYYQGLKNFKQLYVPLSLDYNITKAIALSSGVRLRYTYSEELDPNIPIISQPGPSRRPVTEVSVFNNTNLGFSAGVKYRFNPHWSIFLDSEWGMTNLLKRADFGTTPLQYEINVFNLRTNFTF